MKKQFTFFLFFTFSFLLGLAAQNGTPNIAGARGAAMGNTGITFTDINSIFSNQAGLANMKGLAAAISGEQRFLLTEINSLSAGVAYGKGFGTFGLSLGYYGFKDYNEQKIGLAYARKLFDKLSIGLQFDFLNTQIAEYGSKGLVTFEIGLQSQITKKIHLAAHVFSPATISVTEDDVLPTVFKLGGAYLPSDRVTFLIEVEKDLDYPVQVKAGLEYQILDAVSLRAGVGTNPTLMSFGVGYQLKSGLSIDVGARVHQVLGVMPAVGMVFQGAGKKKKSKKT